MHTKAGGLDVVAATAATVIAAYGAVVLVTAGGARGGLGGLGAIALAGLLAVCFTRAGRALRAVVALLAGLAAFAVGVGVHVIRLATSGARPVDVAGAALALAGVALVFSAFRLALAGRPWGVKLLGVLAGLMLLQWFVLPVIGAGIATNSPRPRVAAARTLGLAGARDVTFAASDGVRLAGWYVPGRTDAAVIVLHGSHGTRADALRHVRMLAAAGFGVLAFDARGHGASGGQTNALGWQGARDVAGAVRFLASRPGVDPRRIAALGLSMGAEEALRAAAQGVALRAVVADGAGASTLADQRLTSSAAIPSSVGWVTMRATEVLSGEREPPSLGGEVARIRVPVLLIASNRSGERAIDAIYARRIGRRASLWFVGDAAHTRALQTHPRAYAARVDAFLAAALR